MKKWLTILLIIIVLFITGCNKQNDEGDSSLFFFPGEEELHEGTWLTWPHKYCYNQAYYFGEEGKYYQ